MCIYEYEKKSFQELLSSKSQVLDFSGFPVVRTLHFRCRGHRFHPWSGNLGPTCYIAQAKQKKNEKRKKKPRFSQCSEAEKKMRGNEAKSVAIHE